MNSILVFVGLLVSFLVGYGMGESQTTKELTKYYAELIKQIKKEKYGEHSEEKAPER